MAANLRLRRRHPAGCFVAFFSGVTFSGRRLAGYFVAFISAAAFVALFARRVPAGYFLAGS